MFVIGKLGNFFVKFWNEFWKNLVGKILLGIFLPKLVGKVLLAMLGIFFQNVPAGNLFGTLAKFWNFYLGKLLFGNLGEPFESIILGKLGESWENFTWENFMWENLEFLIWENFVAHICWTKAVWKNFIKGSVRTNFVEECVWKSPCLWHYLVPLWL